MTQQEKELLIKDLCSRLPYGVKLETLEGPQELDIKWLSINMCNIASPYLPYLLPLSSMTEEDKFEFRKLITDYDNKESMGNFIFRYEELLEELEMIGFFPYEIYDWLNKNHFDYRGLIEKSLALDATNLNIY